MKRIYLLLTLVLLSVGCIHAYDAIPSENALHDWQQGGRHFVIVTATYNNAEWYKKHLDSVLGQTYHDYHVVITDDASPDGTANLIAQYLDERHAWNRTILIKNSERKGAMQNQYNMIHNYCNPTDIVVIVDGDDWLIDSGVLSYLASVYADPTIWLTYGQFIEYPSGIRGFCCDIPPAIARANGFRDFANIPSHLRTFYAGLFHNIAYVDLCEKNGKPLRMCVDIGAMFPMIEMARAGHFKFISRPLLVYNTANTINNHKVSKSLQRSLDLDLRRRRRYCMLSKLF